LNGCEAGRPEVVLEGSIISARRTAASAALGARTLLEGERPERVGLIGNGLINYEIARFLRILCGAERFLLYALDAVRAERFAVKLGMELGPVEAKLAMSLEE